MSQITVIYGSTTGTTQSAAERIAQKLNARCVDIASAKAEDLQTPVLVLGTSTWGFGDLQDDWMSAEKLLQDADLSGKKTAFFGFGDQSGFGDTFVDAMGILCQTALEKGAILIGKTSTEGYSYGASRAEIDGEFCGLALDDANQPEMTDARIDAWTEQLLKEIG
ncbi:MAG: flavodoxin [Planctomycetaceae bacterium]|nr:flavodoxin [Planctomycetaceae bacterium]